MVGYLLATGYLDHQKNWGNMLSASQPDKNQNYLRINKLQVKQDAH